MNFESQVFLVNDGNFLKYSDVLDFVNSAKIYCPNIKIERLEDFFLNLTLALSQNLDVVLIDPKGCENTDLNTVEIKEKVSFKTVEDLISAVKNSTSKISLFTSGTLGVQKKFTHHLQNLIANVKYAPNAKKSVWGYAYAPFHMAGLQVFFQAFLNESMLINLFKKEADKIMLLVDKFKISHISATPTFFRLLTNSQTIFTSLKRITLGGEASDENLHKNILRIFPNAKINNIYASTEAASLLVSDGTYFEIPEKLSEKVIIKNSEIYLHKSLLAHSDSIKFDGDFYPTKDEIEFVDAKRFKFLSRKTDILNVGGYKIDLKEVEASLLALDGVLAARAFGKKNSVLGNLLAAEIVLKKGVVLDIPQIRSNLAKHLQNHKIPREIVFVEEIKTANTGKIQR